MDKSTHRVEVVSVRLEPHPNADSLSIVRVFGYQVCVRSADWKDGQLGAYIVPDSVVPDTPMFSFLGSNRIKVRRLRGMMSQGLLVPAPEGSKEGDDVSELMGVTRYEPPMPMSTGGEDEVPPKGYRPCYDVESWHRYNHLLVPGEIVSVTEKIHGASGRYSFQDGIMHVGSRNTWKRANESNLWWRALRQNPWIEDFCRRFKGTTLYGEVFGQVQDMKYDARKNDIFFRAFDVWSGKQWENVADWYGVEKVIPVPELYRGRYDETTIRELADGKSTIASHIREGCVIRPIQERTDPQIGRVVLKLVSDDYLERG